MLKVIEVLAESDKSWEDAAASAVKKAAKTVHGIKSIYIQDMEASVKDNKIVSYRINAKFPFSSTGNDRGAYRPFGFWILLQRKTA